jgi:hypothetical protein
MRNAFREDKEFNQSPGLILVCEFYNSEILSRLILFYFQGLEQCLVLRKQPNNICRMGGLLSIRNKLRSPQVHDILDSKSCFHNHNYYIVIEWIGTYTRRGEERETERWRERERIESLLSFHT